MEITSDGLTLGAGTVLAKMARDRRGAARLALDDEPRAMALLATAYEQPRPMSSESCAGPANLGTKATRRSPTRRVRDPRANRQRQDGGRNALRLFPG